MKKLLFAIFMACSYSLHASPENITFIFLTEESAKTVLDSIEKVQFGPLSAENSIPKNCIPMGDGCFHPQHGFIESDEDTKKEAVKEVPSAEAQVKTINSLETNMIDCEEGNHFDIFCGKSKKDEKKAEIEVWFDVSTSMRRVDWDIKDTYCKRRAFGEKLRRDCKKGVSFSSYNTSIKEVSDLSVLCTYVGDNNSKRLIQWIDNSTAKHLIVITDIDEMSTQFNDYLDMLGAKIVGVGTKPFYSTDLDEWAEKNLKSCY